MSYVNYSEYSLLLIETNINLWLVSRRIINAHQGAFHSLPFKCKNSFNNVDFKAVIPNLLILNF